MAALRTLVAEEKYDEALDAVRAIKASGYTDAALLVLEATAIQMGEGGDYTIADARRALEEAATDPGYADAAIELGWYTYSVDDDAAVARKYFEQALETLRGQMTSALEGAVKAIRESESDEAAAEFLAEATERLIDAEALKTALQED